MARLAKGDPIRFRFPFFDFEGCIRKIIFNGDADFA
jgi:hypothetical protein